MQDPRYGQRHRFTRKIRNISKFLDRRMFDAHAHTRGNVPGDVTASKTANRFLPPPLVALMFQKNVRDQYGDTLDGLPRYRVHPLPTLQLDGR